MPALPDAFVRRLPLKTGGHADIIRAPDTRKAGPVHSVVNKARPVNTSAARVFLKAASQVTSNFTGVAFGHYFLAGKPVSRDEYLSARPNRQGKPGKAERQAVAGLPKPPAGLAAQIAAHPGARKLGLTHEIIGRMSPDAVADMARQLGVGEGGKAGPPQEPPGSPHGAQPAPTVPSTPNGRPSPSQAQPDANARARPFQDLAKEHARKGKLAGLNGDKETAKRHRDVAAQYRRVAGYHSLGEHDAAEKVRRRVEQVFGLDSTAQPPPLPQRGSATPPPLPKRSTSGNAAGSSRQAQPPALPHEKTQAAALSAANELATAAKSGDRKATQHAYEQATNALRAHLRQGVRAIDRMAEAKYGPGPKGRRAAAKAKEAFRLKVAGVGRRLTALRLGMPSAKALGPFPATFLASLLPPAPEAVFAEATTGVFDMQPDLVPWKAKRLNDSDLAYLLPDPGLDFDGGKMCVHVVASTDRMDRERDIVVPKGGDFTDHRKNPIVLLNHRKDLPGIAKAMDADGNYTVRLANDHEIHSSHYFDQKSKLSVQTFRAVESGALGGVSISFQPAPGTMHKALGPDKHPVFIYPAWSLLEITHAPIGVNPDAVVRAVEKGFGGESLCPELKEVLIPFVPERKPLATGGWEKPTVSEDINLKAMGTMDDSGGGTLAGDDDSGGDLTRSGAFYHTMHAAAENLIGLIEEELRMNEGERTRDDANELLTLLGKVLDVCRDGHSTHMKDFPDQAPLPDPTGMDDDDANAKAFAREALRAWGLKVKAMHKELSGAEIQKVQAVAEVLREKMNDSRTSRLDRLVFRKAYSDLASIKGGVTPAVEEDEDAALARVLAEMDRRAKAVSA